MARTRSWNPIAFLPLQVSIIGSAVYIALFAVLLWLAHTVPSAPSTATPAAGINLTQAWLDLEQISDGYHPWGSRRNDLVREYLLRRVGEILEGVDHETVYAVNGTFKRAGRERAQETLVTVFANDTSNFTAWDDWTKRPYTLYGESENIIVYIRGQDDRAGEWWNETAPYEGASGVLVSAHYDSVASGFGATDDGVGVVTILQLISHFTRKGNRPKRGVIALMNNGEENGLYGARAYVHHPVAQFAHTFVNLEGAGAGGRAMLFRSTDTEVTKAYQGSPLPFGSVITGDGFKQGFVRSGTDYSVFTEELGLRGLDIAFFEPRARYHTDQDDTRDTGPESVWHMLSASLATMQSLTSHEGNEFEGSMEKETGKVDTGSRSNAVWFDLFGRVFAVGQLNTLFAFSVTLLVAGPIILILLEVLIRRSGKWYPLGGKKYLHSQDDDDAVRLHGRRGFFRFPLAFVVATAVVMALAYLVTKVNPLILYSSEYAVWAMMISGWFAVAWFFLAGAAEVRPTALHRMFVLIWLYVISWILLVLATVGEHTLQLAAGYFLVIYNASVFVALLISYLELCALPKISKYVEHVLGVQVQDDASTRPGSRSSRRLLDDARDDGEPNERTSLLSGGTRANQNTFTGLSRRRPDRDEVPEDTDDPFLNRAYEDEQAWSSSLPQCTWFLQFLVLAPINIIIVGQIALILTASLHQTPADGNPVLPPYLFFAILTVLLLLPLSPFLHRFTFHVPTFLLLVFVGCLAYNLTAFPFSREARMKYYFVQEMDLKTGQNNVTLSGLDGFLQDIIGEMPSSAGQPVNCGDTSAANRKGLISCQWSGLTANVVPEDYLALTKNSSLSYQDWLDVNTTHNGSSALITLRGLSTKQCRLRFDNPVSEVLVEDGATDPRQQPVPEGGSTQVRMFSRTWDKVFQVNVTWDGTQSAKGQKGRAECMWADANSPGIIPAFDELKRFEPVWSVATKNDDGLVVGFKDFEV
ncbi:Vacuolar membrane protease [Lecanosticta acicola]|uniref:Peptide hydrolase n=1 Tax=Lecanosticta acicola TaxID=111012 RepID=A0AAI8Z045_9PEZI|nr:Vacuolar membrane protease [Lecanosticta acicola]